MLHLVRLNRLGWQREELRSSGRPRPLPGLRRVQPTTPSLREEPAFQRQQRRMVPGRIVWRPVSATCAVDLRDRAGLQCLQLGFTLLGKSGHSGRSVTILHDGRAPEVAAWIYEAQLVAVNQLEPRGPLLP